MSSTFHTRSVTPAAIAGVVFLPSRSVNVLSGVQKW
jgi:hypothetical protein